MMASSAVAFVISIYFWLLFFLDPKITHFDPKFENHLTPIYFFRPQIIVLTRPQKINFDPKFIFSMTPNFMIIAIRVLNVIVSDLISPSPSISSSLRTRRSFSRAVPFLTPFGLPRPRFWGHRKK